MVGDDVDDGGDVDDAHDVTGLVLYRLCGVDEDFSSRLAKFTERSEPTLARVSVYEIIFANPPSLIFSHPAVSMSVQCH